jgi:hypothetical protein
MLGGNFRILPPSGSARFARLATFAHKGRREARVLDCRLRIHPYRISPEYLPLTSCAIVPLGWEVEEATMSAKATHREMLENWFGITLAIALFISALSLPALANHLSLTLLLH